MIDRMDSVNPHAYSYAFLNKTCTLIEEPLLTVDNCETYKLIMGGEAMLLNPKNCEPFVYEQEGFVVITANGIPWSRYDPIPYNNRCYSYHLSKVINFTEFITVDVFWTVFEQWSLQLKEQSEEEQEESDHFNNHLKVDTMMNQETLSEQPVLWEQQ